MDTIRVFIGTEPKQWLPTEVLRWSIQSRTSKIVDFQELKHLELNLKGEMYTGFSFYRFAIPEQCQYQGRAIYLDADIVVLTDINDLFTHEMDEYGALARPLTPGSNSGRYTSVMLLDNTKLKHWKIREWVDKINQNRELYNDTLWVTPNGLNSQDFGDLEPFWNHLDQHDASTKIIHYTNVPMQPWKRTGHPFASVFLKELKAAIDEDEIPVDAIEREIRQGHIYPEILQDLERLA
ncbi:MAG: glycosyltransferase [Parachlamydiaceae bacterium]